MRCRTLIPLVVLLVALVPSRARAEPLIQTLPEDGDWVKFHANMNIAGRATTPVWTVKAVGKKQVAGEDFRWIELQSKEEDRNVVLFKCLIAESEFGKGKNPLAHARQVFVKFADQEPREFESLAKADAPLALILNGPAKLTKQDAKEAVELQSGRIECDVFTGQSTSEIGAAKFELTYRLLTSDKLTYRFAGAKFQFNVDVAGKKTTASIELFLKETGKDARSELPAID